MTDEEVKYLRFATEEDKTKSDLFKLALDRRYLINDLVKENAEQKEQIESLAKTNIKAQTIIAEQKEQIEKMKRHENCKYRHVSVMDFPFGQCPCSNCSNYDKWELAE